MNSIMIAIALLCQVPTGTASFSKEQREALGCQKYYVNCWKQNRESQRKQEDVYDPDGFLLVCVTERKL